MARKKKAGKKKPRDPNPEDALRDLEHRIEQGLPRVSILRGDEAYFRERGVRALSDRARADGLEVCRHDPLDPDYSAGRLVDDLSTGALFQASRCIVLHHAERVVVDRASAFSAAVRDAMLAWIASASPGAIVLSADKLRADHALAKAVKEAEGPIVGCRRLYDTPPPWNPDPRNTELAQWCGARARSLGVKLDSAEAYYVVAATGNDLNAIEDRLKGLVGRGSEAIQELVTWDSSASVWDVAESLVAGDVRKAAVGIETLFSGGAVQRDGSRTLDQSGIVAQLSTAVSAKLREAVRGAGELEAGRGVSAAAAAAGVRGPKPAVDAFERRMGSRAPGAWKPMLEDFARLERRSRSSVQVDATDFMQLALRWRGSSAGSGSRSRGR